MDHVTLKLFSYIQISLYSCAAFHPNPFTCSHVQYFVTVLGVM